MINCHFPAHSHLLLWKLINYRKTKHSKDLLGWKIDETKEIEKEAIPNLINRIYTKLKIMKKIKFKSRSLD